MSGGDDEKFARRLESVDFSAESRVRAGLRARLLAKRDGAGGRPAARRALVAAVLLLAFAPLAARLARDERRAPAYPRGAQGLPVLPGRFAADAASAPARLFATAKGRETASKDGHAVLWELDGAEYRLESRRIAPEELFDKSRFRGAL